jgi:hypothetical protein
MPVQTNVHTPAISALVPAASTASSEISQMRTSSSIWSMVFSFMALIPFPPVV